MTPLRMLLLATSVAVSTPGIASADELKLSDGRVLYGVVTERGDEYVVETRGGTERVLQSAVERRRSDADLIAELEALRARGPGLARVELEIARLAYRYDLDEQLWDAAARAAAAPDRSATTDERLDRFLGTLKDELLPRRLLRRNEERQVRELVFRVRKGRSAIQVRAIRAVLGASDLGEETLRELARKSTTDERRETALAALWQRAERAQREADRLARLEDADGAADQGGNAATDDGGEVAIDEATGAADRAEALRRFTYRTALIDADAALRHTTMHWAREAGRDVEVVGYLGSALVHDHPSVRIRAADSFGALRTPAAGDALVATAKAAMLAGSGTASPRAHVAFIEQRAYIRDFEVEIASGAFIADPQVDVLQSGAVLDVKVAGSYAIRYQVREAFRRSLARIGGSDPGNDPDTWSDWWASAQAAHEAGAATTARR